MTIRHDPQQTGAVPALSPLDDAIARALAQTPAVRMPADFAARTARAAVAQLPARANGWTGWGPRIAMCSAAVLTAAMFALAPGAFPSLSNLRFDMELLLLVELSGVLLFSGFRLSGD